MKAPYIAKKSPLNRRGFLRGSGVALMLPFLEAMEPVFHPKMRADSSSKVPRRLLGFCNNLGVLPGRFFPEETGRNFKLSPYLEELKAHRDDLTVFSGVSHPGVDGSHSSDVSFLTAAPHPDSGGFRNSISLDQYIAGKIGHQTRFPSLPLDVNAKEGKRSLSWTHAGVLIPCENKITEVYKQLFFQGSEKEVNHQMRRLQLRQSIMDTVAADSKSLAHRLDASDRGRLDQYLTAIREV